MPKERFDVIIAGSRGFTDYELLREKCDKFFSSRKPTHIISGSAKGADLLGQRYADERGIPCILMPAQWDTYGKRAGFIRNQQMLDLADATIAFWDGASSGTRHMIAITRQAGLPCRVIRVSCDMPRA